MYTQCFIALCLFWLGLLNSYSPAYASTFAEASVDKKASAGRQNQTKVDSLEILLNTIKEDTTKAKVLGELAWTYLFSNPDTAFVLAQKELEIAESMIAQAGEETPAAIALMKAGKWQMAHALHLQGTSHHVKGNYPMALKYYHHSLKVKNEIDDDEGMAMGLNNIGIIYKEQGNYTEALEYYRQTLEIFEKLENDGKIAIANNNIGLVLAEQKDYSNALKYYYQSLNITERLGDQRTMAHTYNNIGIIYAELGDSACASNDTTAGIGQYSQALNYFYQALKIEDALNSKEQLAMTYSNIGKVSAHTGDYKTAQEYLDKGLATAKEVGSLLWMKEAYNGLAQLYEKQHEYQKAHTFFKLFTQVKDSLFNEEKSKEIGKLEAKYEFEKTEEENNRLEKEQADLLAEAQRRRDNLQYSGILIFMVLLFAAVFAIGRFSLPIRLAEGIIFFAFLLFFEFTLVLLDPYIEQYSSGAPAIKLAFNALLAGLIFPLHSFFEIKLKSRLVK